MPVTARPRLRSRVTAALLTVGAVAVALAVATPASAATTPTLPAGTTLAAGGSLVSGNGVFRLVMQGDGNLVLYGQKGALWASSTFAGRSTLTMQTDGNAVVRSASGAPVWNSRTPGSGAKRLVVQDDGDVVLLDATDRVKWHTNTATVPDPVSVGNAVPVGVALTPYRFLTSTSGVVTARFASDGSFVVRTVNKILWSAKAGTQPGTRFLLQGDGNVVLYGATAALWNSATKSTVAPAKLVIQDDGNLVAYAANGAAIWSARSFLPKTPTPASDRLVAGQQLVPGAAISSKDGSYKLVQQGDGNLVLYGRAGVQWATNSGGWSGAYSVLQGDGNFVTYGPAGQALWNAGSFGAAVLVVQGDGNLVAYRATGVAVWSSRYSPKPPPLYAPQTSPPPTAVSRYLRNLDGTGADTVFMRSAGCADARAVPNGKRYLTFLAFGAQTANVRGVWGVNLTASTGLITNTAVVAAVKSYIDGYRACMPSYSHLTVAVGTNNDGGDAGLGATGGQVWADQVVDPIAAYAAAGGRVTVAAANDIEPGFAGNAAQAVSWVRGFVANSPAPFVNTGSADGCPQSLGTTSSCNYGWSPKNLYDVTYGLMPGRALPLVQIYYTSMARQWANISLVGAQATGRRMSFAGPLTEVTACAQADSCYSMNATDAWHTLWNQLKADPRTVISDLQYTTDLRIDR